jgi:putative pyruvate formate lyase activating enzyme
MILGGEPTIHLPAALELVSHLPDDAKLVWKTNAHGSAQARALLDGLFDVWLADYKFGNDDCARRLAKVPDYTGVVRENLIWFARGAGKAPVGHTPCLPVDGASLPRRTGGKMPPEPAGWKPALHFHTSAPPRGELIVRHLLMPGHLECCWRPVAEWLAENLPGVKVNLRSGFWPAWKSARHPELRGTIGKNEDGLAWQIAREHNLNLVG